MNIKELILKKLNRNKEIRVSEITQETGFSRAFVQRFFKELQDEDKIILIGRANKAHYILASDKKRINVHEHNITWDLKNQNLKEDIVWGRILKDTQILKSISKNIIKILGYGFTEMLNNAIEHSSGSSIRINFKNNKGRVSFDISDNGVGIFNNIAMKNNLKNITEAIQELIKGKQTTMPEAHSGEGIFFTSKLADRFTIYGSGKKIVFDNNIKDIFIMDNPKRKGTRIHFEINLKSSKNLEDIFRAYTDNSFEFTKTNVVVRLFKTRQDYISRSQARRIVVSLDKFNKITLDFDRVETVGQGFADEIFRIWQQNNPNIKIEIINANENVVFMINHIKNAKY